MQKTETKIIEVVRSDVVDKLLFFAIWRDSHSEMGFAHAAHSFDKGLGLREAIWSHAENV